MVRFPREFGVRMDPIEGAELRPRWYNGHGDERQSLSEHTGS